MVTSLGPHSGKRHGGLPGNAQLAPHLDFSENNVSLFSRT
eukprot:CCRYP_012859-RA/>CCRYP_012859-RA protein AED:0.00 eAED:0.00 QI:29/1/1/1/1/0.5/2/63/39